MGIPYSGYQHNVDYQGTNIWHQTYKFNTSLKLRAYSNNTYKLDEQTVEEALAIRSLFIYMNKKISQIHED